MAITQATTLADFSTGIGTAGAVLQVDNADQRIGIGTTDPQGTLQVGIAITMDGTAGVITASSFSGSGGNLTFTGADISAATGTFTGNVSVGGTLTYEDVTNIDAVGVITARSDVSIADKIIHTGDTNTAIRFPAADTFTVETGGSEALRVDSSQRLLLNTNSARTNYFNSSSYGPLLNLEGTGNSNRVLSFIHNDNSGAPLLVLGATGGSSAGSNTIIGSSGKFGFLSFQGADGSQLVEGAKITGEVDATPGADDMPGRLVFSTTADGAASPTERLRITSAGLLRIPDNGKFTAGAGDDIQIYHDGSNSYFTNSTGQLYVGGSRVKLTNAAVTEVYVDCVENGRVDLMYDAVVKLTTKSDGVDITGELQCDSLDVDGNIDIHATRISYDTSNEHLKFLDNIELVFGNGNDLKIFHDGSNSIINDNGTGNLRLQAAGTTRLEVTTSGATVTGTLNATTDVTIDGKSAATTGKSIAMAFIFG